MASDALISIEHVSSRIEDTFARVGGQLGRGHAIFQDLNQDLNALSRELSGAEIADASQALQDVASRLNGLAEALPAESLLLDKIGKSAAEAASLLKPLFKHIQMITIVARSARIEAASLDGDRENFLAFTQEAYDLGMSVQHLIEGCTRDQELLTGAVETALNRQKDFELHYRALLGSTGAELTSAHGGIKERRSNSVHLADMAEASTRKIADQVGRAIVSLQAGDSTRQRLEHVCNGLRRAAGPALPDVGEAARSIARLQAAQLKDAQHEFEGNIGQIVHSFSAILAAATAAVDHGRSVFGGKDGDSSSFLARVRQALAHASDLIATCESGGRSVDDALTVVEDTMAKFRHAISRLSEAVVDITLIGMNASLRAGRLGSKGNAFVVIANELKATADQLAGGASSLKPILDRIEQVTNELRELRVRGDPTQLANLAPSILQALREVEAGNDRLSGLMSRLVGEAAEFEALMNAAQGLMQELGEAAAALPSVAARLDTAGAATPGTLPTESEQAALDELYTRYTMERERAVHGDFLRQLGLAAKPATREAEIDDGVLLF